MDMCVVYGPLISIAVSLLKRIPFVNKQPVVVAAVLSLIAAVIGVGAEWKQHMQQIVQCVIIALTGAIGFFEVVTKNVRPAKE